MSQTKVQLIKDGALAEDSILHDGDTNTKIRFPAADTVTLETGGSERARVDSDGRLGIGTSAPESNLHVHVSSASTGPFLRFTNPNGGDGTYLGRISCGDTAGSFLTGINFFKHDTDDGEIRFRSKVGGANTDVCALVDGAALASKNFISKKSNDASVATSTASGFTANSFNVVLGQDVLEAKSTYLITFFLGSSRFWTAI